MEEALRPGAPLVHPDWRTYEILFEGPTRGGNVAWQATVARGDADAAFARDDVTIVESQFRRAAEPSVLRAARRHRDL